MRRRANTNDADAINMRVRLLNSILRLEAATSHMLLLLLLLPLLLVAVCLGARARFLIEINKLRPTDCWPKRLASSKAAAAAAAASAHSPKR